MWAILTKMFEKNLYVKLENREFHKTSVKFLSCIQYEKGVKMDQGKVDTIRSHPPTKATKEMQCFLGFKDLYRHFIRWYSVVAAPLTFLVKGKSKELTWNCEAHKAYKSPLSLSYITQTCN